MGNRSLFQGDQANAPIGRLPRTQRQRGALAGVDGAPDLCAPALGSANGAIASLDSLPYCARHCGLNWTCVAFWSPMGQPEAVSDFSERQNRPTCLESSDAMGQPKATRALNAR